MPILISGKAHFIKHIQKYNGYRGKSHNDKGANFLRTQQTFNTYATNKRMSKYVRQIL